MPKHPKTDEHDQNEKSHADALLDEVLKQTFPASDPSAMTGVDGVKADISSLRKSRGSAGKK